MQELREVSVRRTLERLSKEMLEKKKELERTWLLRPSALAEIIQLMHARSLWPSVMKELTLKFAYKSTECYEKVLEEENWMNEPDDTPAPDWMIAYKNQTVSDPKVLEEQEGWVTDDDDDGAAAPAPIQRPPLQIRRRRGRRGNPLCVRFAPY